MSENEFVCKQRNQFPIQCCLFNSSAVRRWVTAPPIAILPRASLREEKNHLAINNNAIIHIRCDKKSLCSFWFCLPHIMMNGMMLPERKNLPIELFRIRRCTDASIFGMYLCAYSVYRTAASANIKRIMWKTRLSCVFFSAKIHLSGQFMRCLRSIYNIIMIPSAS